MPELGPSGSVRGAPSNGRPYRDTVEDVSKALGRRRNQNSSCWSGTKLGGSLPTGRAATGMKTA